MEEFLQKNGVLIMERIMLLDKDMPNIGLTFRITTKGDECELVREFVEFYIDMFKRINRKSNLAVFIEPRVETGFPDIVFAKLLWSSFFVTLRPNFCHRVYATP